ncbi:MAG: hypothetical protein R3D29_11030 [Nitratireductor sp.]
MREAHLRDGRAAMIRFLAWIDRQDVSSLEKSGQPHGFEELRLETAAAGSELCEISFDTPFPVSDPMARSCIIGVTSARPIWPSLPTHFYLVDLRRAISRWNDRISPAPLP